MRRTARNGRLTEEQIGRLRAAWLDPETTGADVARRFGVSRTTCLDMFGKKPKSGPMPQSGAMRKVRR